MFWKLQEDVLDSTDLDALVEFIRHTTRFTQFTAVREFEQAYAAWQGCQYAVFVNSGSSANLLLVNAHKELGDWQPGDEVIVPAVTWPTTITPVMQAGLTPVFADVRLEDFSFDLDDVARKITPRTRAIFAAHLLGFPGDIGRLREIAAGRNIAILEDCCESQGATVKGTKVGNLADGGTFSFYWGHHMTSVEGGMICTDNEALYKLCLLKRSHGLARELPPEYHAEIKARYPDIDFHFLFLTDGFNLRNTEFSAVLGRRQLGRIDEYIRIRNANYERFAALCNRHAAHVMTPWAAGMSSFVLPFLFRDAATKDRFQRVIRERGIESRPLISGNLLRQPFLSRFAGAGAFPNAEFLHTNAFYVGNNQFVDAARLDVLADLMSAQLG